MAPIALSPETHGVENGPLNSVKHATRGRNISDPVTQNVELNDGNKIPQVALGVYKAPNGEETENAVLSALDAGYRHIDSAARYMNEEACGRAINRWLIDTKTPRDEVFVTSKLWDADHGYDNTTQALDESLRKLNLTYIDMYLIHSPADCEEKRLESWRALEDAQKAGKVRSIGVSNFGESHMRHILEHGSVVPVVNQVEIHPFCQRADLVDLCHKHGVLIEAYSPLARGNKLEDEKIGELAVKYGKTPAQILLNWNASRGNVVLPKSLTPSRIKSNAEIFDFKLSTEDIAAIDALGEQEYVTGTLHKSN